MSSLDLARTGAVNQNSLMRVVMGSVTGTMIEWYDFYIFGSLTSVLAVKFYPPGNDTFCSHCLSGHICGDRFPPLRPFGIATLLRCGSVKR